MTIPYGLMADLHLHAWSSFASTDERGVNTRLAGLLGEIRRCAEEVKAAGGEHIFMAGDIFHVRGSVSPTVLNATRDCFAQIHEELGVRVVIMPGNHDLEGKESTRLSSAVTALEDLFAKVLNEPTYLNFGDYRACFVPWVESIDALKELVGKLGASSDRTMPESEFLRSNADLILHAPIDGVIKGLPAHGLDPDYLASLGFKRVFAGHYHNHKLMYHGRSGTMTYSTDVYSIGALAHHTWSDVGSRAGYLLVYPDRVDYRKSHLPEFIDLSQLADVEPDDIPMLVDQNYVRVKVEASKTKEVEQARQELLEMGAKAVIVQAMPKPPAREGEGGAPAVATASGASLETSVGDFIKAMVVDTARQAAVTKAALAVLESASALGD